MRQVVHGSTDNGDVPIIEAELWEEFMRDVERNWGDDSNEEAQRHPLVRAAYAI
jgi:hypothetical protein